MGIKIDRTGQRFGRLLVLAHVGYTGNAVPLWLCRCDCGNEKAVRGGNLQNGNTQSCGCISRERTAVMGSKWKRHGLTGTPELKAWSAMRTRCSNPTNPNYSYYGGRGITVAKEWDTFEQFYADMGPRPSDKHSLDRIDNNGPYAPWNCRWATRFEQIHNRRPKSEWRPRRKSEAA